jgi:Tol biopolymer transport system component/C-terminal processing protease CtpA/Prc
MREVPLVKHRISTFALFLPIVALAAAPRPEARAADGAAAPALLGEPSLSPDGSEIAFVSGGDIWTVPVAGGAARLLVSDPATEARPLYSPDGRRLAFTSTRGGGAPEVYVLDLEGGALRRLTYDDAPEVLDGWSPDGRWVYFSTPGHDISRMNDVYRVPAEGGTPTPVVSGRYVNESMSALSPDGQRLAFVGRGFTQWWRRGSSHIDHSALWLRREGRPPRYERLTDGTARDSWPMWAPDGRGFYFVSDRGGIQNVWYRPLEGAPRAVTSFRDGRVVWPAIAARAGRIAFERDFGIWIVDTASGKTAAVPITLRGAAARRPLDHLSLTSRLSDLALSPDGKKVAFVARGDVYAASAKDGGDADRVTATDAAESDLTWSADSNRLIYASERDGVSRLYLYDYVKKTERPLSAGPGDAAPRVSPNGKEVAFTRDGREIRVVDVASGRERVAATGQFDRPPFIGRRDVAWSPDGKYLAYFAVGERLFSNVWIAPAAGGEARPASFLANVGGNAIAWSPDGTYLLFTTGQRTENGQLARVDLLPRVPRFREDQFRELFREETPPALAPSRPAPAASPAASPSPSPSPSPSSSSSPVATFPAATDKAPKPVEIAFDGIRQRTSLLPVGVDAGDQVISPDGKWVVLIATAAGQSNLWVYPLDELAKEDPVARQLTSTPGDKADPAFSPDGKEVFYLDQGRIQVVPLDGRPRPLAVTAERDIDFDEETGAVYTQAWTYLRDNFHDAAYHGVDWTAVRAAYAPRVEASRTPDELRRTLNLMIGELDASHTGVLAPSGNTPSVIGRVGLSFDREELESSGRLRIASILPNGPADVTRALHVGDVVTAVEGAAVDRRTGFDALLQYRIGKRTALTVAPAAGGPAKEVVVRPTSMATEKGLLYREWVEGRRAEVARLSHGRLGYVHLFDMSGPSLTQLSLDLDAENVSRDGVVVDVRNNNGGFVNVYAIDVLARREYLQMTPRGLPTSPARTVLGQRALGRPTVLLTNQDSLSDAEDFTEGYRALGLGKVVGEPTAGWIIYTGNQALVDGSFVRLPRITITTAKGEPMEGHPRPVDVPVDQPLGDGAPDAQLEAAVRELTAQLGTKR